MKKAVVMALLVSLLVPTLASARDERLVKPEKGEAVVLVGESFTLATGPGESCVIGSYAFPLERPDEKQSCSFKAVNTGDAEVEIKGVKARKIKVKSLKAYELPRVMIGELTSDPGKYGEGLVMIEGENRGWGAPAKAKKVWGEAYTRSDWILEDETGATYISGRVKPDYKFARVVLVARKWQGKWGLQAVHLEEAEVVLKPDVVNVLRVGQMGVVLAAPSKSHTPEVRVKGEAVKPEKDDRERIYLRAVAEGEVEAELYHHWWMDFQNIDGISAPGAPKPEEQPVAVFKIKVVP